MPDEKAGSQRFCPCAVCAVITPVSVAPACYRIDLALTSGTLRLHLCKDHDAYAQKIVAFLVPVQETATEEEEEEEEEDAGDQERKRWSPAQETAATEGEEGRNHEPDRNTV